MRNNYILIRLCYLIGRKESVGEERARERERERKMPSDWCWCSFASRGTNDNDCQVIVCLRVRVFPRARKQEINNLSGDDDDESSSSLLMIVGRTSEWERKQRKLTGSLRVPIAFFADLIYVRTNRTIAITFSLLLLSLSIYLLLSLSLALSLSLSIYLPFLLKFLTSYILNNNFLVYPSSFPFLFPWTTIRWHRVRAISVSLHWLHQMVAMTRIVSIIHWRVQ